MCAKRALLVGINYAGTKAELKGCHNDVDRMYRCLVGRFGFDPAEIRVLLDGDPSTPQPTGANIRKALAELVESASPGDVLFFHYSGHGTRLPAETGLDDDTGYDECIVPCDMNLITDEDITQLMRKVPDECLFTIVSDSCHSGGLLDKAKEQIGHSTRPNSEGSGSGFRAFLKGKVRDAFASHGIDLPRGLLSRHRRRSYYGDEEPAPEAFYGDYTDPYCSVQIRSLPLSTLIDMLKEQTGNDNIDIGSLRMTLFNMFGDDASPKVKKFMKIMLNQFQQGQSSGSVMSLVGSLAMELMKAKLDAGDPSLEPAMNQEVNSVEEVYAGTTDSRVPRNGVLISGCQTNQTSADVTTSHGESFGALSNAIQIILEMESEVSNMQLVLNATEMLSKKGYKQQPGLYCSDEHANVAFIC